MSVSTWLAFLFVSLAASFSPGPGVLLALSTSAAMGPRRTVYSSAGNALGVFIVATVAVTGVGLLLQTSSVAFVALKTAGAGYLIYLGVRQWRRPVADSGTDAPALPAAAVITRSGIFLRGLMVALTNPKSMLFFTAIFPQFMQAGRPDPARFLLLTSTFVACVLMSHLFYVGLAVRMGNRMLGSGRTRNINRAGGLLFVVLGCATLTLSAPPL